jgi:hypothetical protein
LKSSHLTLRFCLAAAMRSSAITASVSARSERLQGVRSGGADQQALHAIP